jgi:hypothetical protein
MISAYTNALDDGSRPKYLGCTGIIDAIVVSDGKEKLEYN